MALINVSATLFQIMLALKVPVDSVVTLYLEDDGPLMVFGIIIDDQRLIDLWHYTVDQIPRVFFQ